MRLPDRTRDCLIACAEASLPAGARLPAGGEETVATLEEALDHLPPAVVRALDGITRAADLMALRYGKRSLAGVSVARRFQLLEAWRTAPSYAVRSGFRMLLAGLKAAHYGRRDVAERAPCRLPMASIAQEPAPRWMSQVTDLAQSGADEELEADVVIIGTGAGGGAAARVLAAAGLAVVMLEEGPYHTRADFAGSVLARTAKLYSRMGLQTAFGNVSLLLPSGRGVGGTTTINAGTCLRAPPWVMKNWREEHAVPLTEEEIEPYFERVERWLEVSVAPMSLVGMQGVVIARGADKLGLAHGPLPRNAPGCDGQGVCCFGCPTGAKRSADVALVPAALSSGAVLFTNARVDTIAHSHTAGVRVRARSKNGRSVQVQARTAIVAAGSLVTPLLLQRSGISHPMLGKNLSIHPAAAAIGLFPFDIHQDAAIPQGYGLDGLREQGLLFEGGGTPFEMTAIVLNLHGPRFVEILEQHHRLLTYGFNVRDTSRGRVVAGPGGRPVPLYNLGQRDVAQMHFGMRTLIDLLVGGGATHVFPPVHGLDEVPARIAGRALDHRHIEASDLDLSAHHPLGTARMGTDPARSVVDMSLRVRSAPNLLVCDGSVIPTSMGHNPQITIMALAARAAERLADRLTS